VRGDGDCLRLADLVEATLPERFKAEALELLVKNPGRASAFLARPIGSHGSWPDELRARAIAAILRWWSSRDPNP
jgi:hypothetical protein